MQNAIDTRKTSHVQAAVLDLYQKLFSGGNPATINQTFQWFEDWFAGRQPGYQAIDAHYHDLEHTLQGALCMARLLYGRDCAAVEPRMTPRVFELGLLAMLLHDTGYLKKLGDNSGTGAKYTLIHVDRSLEFAGEFMRANGFPPAEITAVQNMIRCTGVNVKLESIQFQSELERISGFSLGTADLLGQMAAEDYVDKLPVLFSEFAEAASGNPGKMTAGGFFNSAEDLTQKTPLFWEKYVQVRINRDFLGLYRFLNDPYPNGPNPYVEQIMANMTRIRSQSSSAR